MNNEPKVLEITVEMMSAGAMVAGSIIDEIDDDKAGALIIGVFMAMMSSMEGGTNMFCHEGSDKVFRYQGPATQ